VQPVAGRVALPEPRKLFIPRPAAKRRDVYILALCNQLQVVGAAHTRKLFEKSLIKNFTKVVFCLALCLTFCFAETRVRWPRQDDGAASGSRAELVRVKPDKHRPVLRDEKKLFYVIYGGEQTPSCLTR
jgi:hypothetical protein